MCHSPGLRDGVPLMERCAALPPRNPWDQLCVLLAVFARNKTGPAKVITFGWDCHKQVFVNASKRLIRCRVSKSWACVFGGKHPLFPRTV